MMRSAQGLIMSTILCLTLMGCKDSEMTTLAYSRELEIAPDKWLLIHSSDTVFTADLEYPKTDPHNLTPAEAIEQLKNAGKLADPSKEESSIEFEWNGKRVRWKGKEIPVSLREHDETLFMIGFNREDLRAARFVFLKLNKSGNSFTEIEPKDFPKQIATQNMWIGERYAWVGPKSIKVDRLHLLRTLDVESLGFTGELTSKIWYHLEKNIDYNKIGYIDVSFVKEYNEKYQPIPLPTIVKVE